MEAQSMIQNACLVRSSAPTFRHAELLAVVPALRARALKLCLNGAEAEDLVQDTLERALRFEASYQSGTNLRAWAQQILFSVFVTQCRRRRRERRAMNAFSGDPCSWTVKDEGAAMLALCPNLERMLEHMPEQFAKVIRLVDLGERSYKDAALELGVPVGTIMSRLFRARRSLADALKSTAAEPARAA
jgi:RNA polymerase sigma-70 factor (ECF subfamily)